MPARHELVDAGGVRIECAWMEAPRADAPTLVFLHQGLGSIAQWGDFPAAVCERLECGALLYNRRGHGASDRVTGPLSPRFLHDEAIEVLPAVLDAFSVARPILVGHSDGASIAIIHAASRRGTIRGLVLEAPHLFVEEKTVAGLELLRESYTRSLRARLKRYHGDGTETLFRDWSDVWLSPRFRAWSIEECLDAIDCPVLAIQGRADEYATLRQVTTIAERVRTTTQLLILAACAHSPHVDQPEAVEEAIVGFVREVVRSPRLPTG